MLKAQNLKKSYGKLPVLKGIDLEVKPKEAVSIVGSSGAGKTTLLHLLATLDNPDSGEVWFEERPLHKLSDKKLAHLRNQNFGFVFQFHNLLPEFTALENVTLPALIAENRPKKEISECAHQLLETLGVAERADHKPSELSGGEQQRVAVARALINQPKVLFADEPSGNLDVTNAEKLHQLFFSLRDELDLTLVIVTHNPDLAEMTDRSIRLAEGKLA
ncbi:MAG: ABC transporter ATP-binding protein [Bacteroidota bacterium]